MASRKETHHGVNFEVWDKSFSIEGHAENFFIGDGFPIHGETIMKTFAKVINRVRSDQKQADLDDFMASIRELRDRPLAN